jgi:hypothetical protein
MEKSDPESGIQDKHPGSANIEVDLMEVDHQSLFGLHVT